MQQLLQNLYEVDTPNHDGKEEKSTLTTFCCFVFQI